jgi:hypothetical protein
MQTDSCTGDDTETAKDAKQTCAIMKRMTQMQPDLCTGGNMEGRRCKFFNCSTCQQVSFGGVGTSTVTDTQLSTLSPRFKQSLSFQQTDLSVVAQ